MFTKHFMGYEIKFTHRQVASVPCGYEAVFRRGNMVYTVFRPTFDDCWKEVIEWIRRL